MTKLAAHKLISYLKSYIRIAACFAGAAGIRFGHSRLVLVAFAVLGVAELLGILEEMVVD